MSTNYTGKVGRTKCTKQKLNEAINAFNYGLCNKSTICKQYGIPRTTLERHLKNHTQNNNRCQWTEDQLIQAINSVNNGTSSCRSASKQFGIPRTTLIRHIKEGTKEKKQPGRMPIFGELEKVLKEFLLKEQNSGNIWSMIKLRKIAFNFAEVHNIKHKFNKEKGLASYEWVHAFTNRHPEIIVQTRKYTRQGSDELEVNNPCEFSDMLQIILEEGNEEDILT